MLSSLRIIHIQNSVGLHWLKYLRSIQCAWKLANYCRRNNYEGYIDNQYMNKVNFDENYEGEYPTEIPITNEDLEKIKKDITIK